MDKRERDEARDYINTHPELFLKLAKNKKSYVCPYCGSGTGKHGTGMTTKDGLHYTCWACSEIKNNDIVDIIGIVHHITDYKQKIEKGIELSKGSCELNQNTAIRPKDRTVKPVPTIDYTAFFKEAHSHIMETNYHRGLTTETLNRFNVGYDSTWVNPHPNAVKTKSPRLIIPTSPTSYIARDTRTDLKEWEEKYKKLKVGEVHLFNLQALNSDFPVYIVEGEIDAMSICDVGAEAVGLGSTSNINLLIKELEHREKIPILILSLDPDKAGQDATNKLDKRLSELNIPHYNINISEGYDDPNDALIKDRTAFKVKVEDTMKSVIKNTESKPEKIISIEEGKKNAPIKWATVNEYGNPLKEDWRNIDALCQSLGISIRFNLFTREVEVKMPNQRTNLQPDTYTTLIRGECARKGFKVPSKDVRAGICTIADLNPYNPIKEYLESVSKKWDGQDHVQDVIDRIEFDRTKNQNIKLCKTLIRKWLVQCVALAYNEGNTMGQGMLIFTGPENIGKSSFITSLLPNQDWGQINLRLSEWENKDDLIMFSGNWLIELGEVGDTIAKRRNTNRLKNLITSKVDEYRPPYHADKVKYPRLTSMYGTNNNCDFLDSLTGNRRYWVVAVTWLDFENNPIDKDQLWATVVNEWASGYSFRLTPEEQSELEKQNLDNMEIKEEEQAVLDSYNWDEPDKTKWHWRNASQINAELINKCKDIQNLGRVLSRSKIFLNGKTLEKKRTGNRGAVYLVPPQVNN